MTARLLAAQPVVEKIKKDLVRRCDELKKLAITPSMSVVLVGNNPASLSYIKNKKRLCEEIGAKFNLLNLPSNISPLEFSAQVTALNNDDSIHGIIIQLPVSEGLKDLDLPDMVVPHKDIDGFHRNNTQKLYNGSFSKEDLVPCTPKGIVTLLDHYGIEVAGKHVVVIGRSLIVGKPLSMLLSNLNATVTMGHSRTKNLAHFTKDADIVVSAIGKTHFLKASYFDPAAKTVVIDVGINTLNGKLTGDVDFENVQHLVSAITPVPGGVGPMTVISLIQNLINTCEKLSKGIA